MSEKIKYYTLTENEKPKRKEWCPKNEEVFINDCSIDLHIYGLPYPEMRMLAEEIRNILKNHGYDTP